MKALQNRINNWQTELDQEATTFAKSVEIYKTTSAMIKELSLIKSQAGLIIKEAGVYKERVSPERVAISGTPDIPVVVKDAIAKALSVFDDVKVSHSEKTTTKTIPTNL